MKWVRTLVLSLAAFVALRGADAAPTDPESGARALARELGSLYESLRKAHGSMTAAELESRRLELLGTSAEGEDGHGVLGLLRIDDRIREYHDDYKDAPLDDMLCWRGCAWLHAWASMSLLLDEAARLELGDAYFARMLSGDSNVLEPLLTGYRQIVARSPGGLPAAIGPSPTATIGLRYRHPVETSTEFALKAGFYLPDTTALLGSPAAEPKLDRDLLSVWEVVYLASDHFREFEYRTDASSPSRPGSAGALRSTERLGIWLHDLARNPALAAFCSGPDPSSELDRTKTGFESLSGYFRVRNRLLDPRAAEAVVRGLTTARAAQKFLTEDVRPLVDAAVDVPAARVLLRHLLVLALDGRQGDRLLGDDAGSLNSVWTTKQLPGNARDLGLLEDDRRAPGVRVGRFPDASTYEGALMALDQRLISRQRIKVALRGAEADAVLAGEDTGRLGEIGRRLGERLRREAAPTSPDDGASRVSTTTSAGWERRLLALDARNVRASVRNLVDRGGALEVALSDPGSLLSRGMLAASAGDDWPSLGASSTLPTMTMSEYTAQIEEARRRLDDISNQATARKEVLAQYTSTRKRVEAMHLTVLAQEVGLEIARRSVEVGLKWERVAELDADADRLNAEADAEFGKEASYLQAAAGLRLSAAERVREVAAARVEALKRAVEETDRLVTVAITKLDAFAVQLKGLADHIRADQQNFLLQVVRAVVDVVGTVLAPLTGGISLQVASLIDRGLQLAASGTLDLATLTGLVKDAANLPGVLPIPDIKLGLIDELRPVLGDVQRVLRGQVSPDALPAAARQVIDRMRGAPAEAMRRLASCVASGFPIELDDSGKISVRVGGDQFHFGDPILAEELRVLLSQRVVVASGADISASMLSKLRSASDVEIRDSLAAILQVAVRPALDATEAEAVSARDRLVAFLRGDKATTAMCRSLAEVISQGAAVVVDGGRVVAWTRPLERELQNAKDRLAAISRRLYEGTIKEAEGNLAKIHAELGARLAPLEKNRDASGIDALAKAVRAEVPRAEEECQRIKDELAKAQEDDENAASAVEIANYESHAADVRVGGYRALSGRDAKVAERDAMRVTIEKDRSRIARLANSGADASLAAAAAGLESAEIDLQAAHDRCLTAGVDPYDSGPARDGGGDSRALSTGRLVLGSSDDIDAARLLAQAQAVDAAVGVAKWIRLLRSPATGNAAIVSLFGAIDADSSPTKVVANLKSLASGWMSSYRAEMRDAVVPASTGIRQVTPGEIVWFDGRQTAMSESEVSRLVSPLTTGSAQGAVGERQVLGAFRYGIFVRGKEPPAAAWLLPDQKANRFTHSPGSGEGASYYVDARRIQIVCHGEASLFFLAVPPVLSSGSERSPYMTGLERPRRSAITDFNQVLQTFEEAGELGQARDAYGSAGGTALAGALGVWTFFIADNRVETPQDRAAAIARLQQSGRTFDLYITYLTLQK